jgi:hypothetical protein
MIIYGENLSQTGFTAAELHKDGKAHDEWRRIPTNGNSARLTTLRSNHTTPGVL